MRWLSRIRYTKEISFTFRDAAGKEFPVKAKAGEHILSIAHANEIDLEGACEASLACSTCHVILPDELFDQLEEAGEEEEDMLDLAFGLSETSRLGCQVYIDERFEGTTIQLPEATRNMAVDGFKPKPH